MAADVGGESRQLKTGKKGRRKRLSPRIDMTPMVDLGFLLLTFFVLTTTLISHTTMPVVVPNTTCTIASPISHKKVLNILISGKDRVYWYYGIKNVELNLVGYNAGGLRKTVVDMGDKIKKTGLFDLRKDPQPMVVLIKMTNDASYKNMVDVLDEMNITKTQKYVLMEAAPEEIGLIQDYEKSQNLKSSVEKSLTKTL